jgi:hypothetical protein
MAKRTREQLKFWFETGDKPTEQQFADLIDSLFSLMDDGSPEVKRLLELLTGTARLKKNAIRGADFALNRRGKGDILSTTFHSFQMGNVLQGDFWIYYLPDTPEVQEPPDPIIVGDWVMALAADATPHTSLQGYVDDAQWEVIHFGDSSVQQQTTDLHHYRTSPTVDTGTIVLSGIHAEVIQMSINKLTYYGKVDDGNFDNYDFVYRHAGDNTEIQINEDGLGFQFLSSMVIDIMYRTAQ